MTREPEEAVIRKQWNRHLSSLRIFVEHAFGRLKGRFPYLRFIPGKDLNEIYNMIEALLIIHNILEARNDDPNTIEGFNGAEADDVDEIRGDAPPDLIDPDEDALYAQGLYRRKLLVDYFVARQANM